MGGATTFASAKVKNGIGRIGIFWLILISLHKLMLTGLSKFNISSGETQNFCIFPRFRIGILK